MSFFISDSLKGKIDKDDLIESKTKNHEHVIDEKKFIKIKNKKNKSVLIRFKNKLEEIKKIHKQDIFYITLFEKSYKKLFIKEIIKKDNYFICTLICEEKTNEDN